jgi:hypothetical protein
LEFNFRISINTEKICFAFKLLQLNSLKLLQL